MSIVGSRENASSVDEVIAFVTSGTVTIGSMSSALVRNGDAFSISILDPVL